MLADEITLPDEILEKISHEVRELRSRDASVFKLKNGRMLAVIKPASNKEVDGSVEPVNLSFTVVGRNSWRCSGAECDILINKSWISVFDKGLNGNDGVTIFIDDVTDIDESSVKVRINNDIWVVTPTLHGLEAHTQVDTRRGDFIYRVRIMSRGNAKYAIAENGDVIFRNTRIVLSCPIVIDAKGRRYKTSGWRSSGSGIIEFAFDDSVIEDNAFPYIIDPSVFVNLPDVYDGTISCAGMYWPITPNNASYANTDTSSAVVTAYAYQSGSFYQVAQGLFRFDRSAVPPGATIYSITLVCYVFEASFSPQDGGGGKPPLLYFEWYDPGSVISWPQDYNPTPDADAAIVELTALNVNAVNYVMLEPPLPSGSYVGLRMAFPYTVLLVGYNGAQVSVGGRLWQTPPYLLVEYKATVDGSAFAVCSASASASGLRVALSSAASTCEATTSATGRLYLSAAAACSCITSTSASGLRIARGAASVTANATVSANGLKVLRGRGDVLTIASVFAAGEVVEGIGATAQCSVTAYSSGLVVRGAAASVVATAAATALGVNTLTGAGSASCACNISANARLNIVGTSSPNVKAIAYATGIGVTSFEQRVRKKTVKGVTFPRYPSRLEEVLLWAQYITRGLETAFNEVIVRQEQRGILSGRLADRPEPTGSYILYWAVDDNNGNGRMYVDDGAWRPL